MENNYELKENNLIQDSKINNSEWKNEKIEGYEIKTYNNGRYEGILKNNKKEG